jgi:hypothetical protein
VEEGRQMKVCETRRHSCGHCGAAHRVTNGKWLRAVRMKADVTMTRIAIDAGVSVQFVNNIERNRRLCPSNVEQVYRRLDVQV